MTTKLIQELVNIATEVSYSRGGYADITRITKGRENFDTLHICMYSSNKQLVTIDVYLAERNAPEHLQEAIDKVKAL